MTSALRFNRRDADTLERNEPDKKNASLLLFTGSSVWKRSPSFLGGRHSKTSSSKFREKVTGVFSSPKSMPHFWSIARAKLPPLASRSAHDIWQISSITQIPDIGKEEEENWSECFTRKATSSSEKLALSKGELCHTARGGTLKIQYAISHGNCTVLCPVPKKAKIVNNVFIGGGPWRFLLLLY